ALVHHPVGSENEARERRLTGGRRPATDGRVLGHLAGGQSGAGPTDVPGDGPEALSRTVRVFVLIWYPVASRRRQDSTSRVAWGRHGARGFPGVLGRMGENGGRRSGRLQRSVPAACAPGTASLTETVLAGHARSVPIPATASRRCAQKPRPAPRR